MSQVMDQVLDAFVAYYKLQMQDGLLPTNPIRPDTVKKGLLQEQKIENNIQVGITGGDHDLPDEIDGIVTLNKIPDIGIYLPAREIGGGQIWMRRGVIRLECFFIAEQLDEDTAHNVAYECLGMTMSLVPRVPVNGITDSYGERAIMAHCYGNTFFESGGGPASFIFRGKILWAVFTERP